MLYTEVMRHSRLFQRCYRQGTCIPGKLVVVYVRENRLPVNRLGITTGKKVGCAVERSRARRLIRAAWREVEIISPIGLDIVIVARRALPGSNERELCQFLSARALPAFEKLLAGSQPEKEGGEAR